uniref:RRM domain-containing protein n=1 Tax=Arion vulgaris TaxID=1028688 RepID=A0A0B6Z737_9EUPU
MAAPMDSNKSLHALKKFEKKLRKIEKLLSSKEQMVISKQPTRILCVQNGGLECNVSQSELWPLFAAFGNIDGIVMIPRKSYSFVSFTDMTCASQALHHLNGHLLREGRDPTQDVILYLFYTETVPSSMMPSSEKPAGLLIVEDFVSQEVEENLLKLLPEGSEETSKGIYAT